MKTTGGKWSRETLLRLEHDFHGKCYLCESVVGPDFEVDHRIPQNVAPELAAEWSNLFPACATCNRHRPKRLPDGGLLSPGEGVERRLRQWLHDQSSAGIVPAFCAEDPGDLAAVNTALELEQLHQKDLPKIAALRKAICEQLIRVHRLWRELARAHGAERVRLEHELRHLLSRRAPFTMLLRAEMQQLRDLFD